MHVLDFDERAFQQVVSIISQESKLLLEVVNHNIQSQQYVCAGHVSYPLGIHLFPPLTWEC